ncbi:PREDICTED: uncharacterized protein LOC102853862 [Elephantulus edwardii]|uniref:uncharacterized protein LOC102853862 n=1 Tax=Elephantulus edwardii TaxID=28737 RepID=UPI0003F0B2C1|nr:PREDICTED: uncharacterized protein LOC102853862 [Elephantulus edwardii]
MAALGSPARTFRGLLRELRHLSAATGRPYRDTPAYRYLVKAFRAHRVTGEKLCRAQQELHFQAATYLCLLRSVREHVELHQQYHGKGERSVKESAGLVGLQLPEQPGGKGWESSAQENSVRLAVLSCSRGWTVSEDRVRVQGTGDTPQQGEDGAPRSTGPGDAPQQGEARDALALSRAHPHAGRRCGHLLYPRLGHQLLSAPALHLEEKQRGHVGSAWLRGPDPRWTRDIWTTCAHAVHEAGLPQSTSQHTVCLLPTWAGTRHVGLARVRFAVPRPTYPAPAARNSRLSAAGGRVPGKESREIGAGAADVHAPGSR